MLPPLWESTGCSLNQAFGLDGNSQFLPKQLTEAVLLCKSHKVPHNVLTMIGPWTRPYCHCVSFHEYSNQIIETVFIKTYTVFHDVGLSNDIYHDIALHATTKLANLPSSVLQWG